MTEADILAEVVAPDEPGLNPAMARTIVALRFSKDARKQMGQLLRKNNRGTITEAERVLLQRYLRVGHFLDLLQAKARLSLRDAADTH